MVDRGYFDTISQLDELGRSASNRGRIEFREATTMSITLDAMLARTADVCGGQIRIDGTRITVHRIATLYKQGQGAEEIVQTYPHLSLGQVYAALAYYHANRAEIESELAAADAEYDQLRQQDFPQADEA